MVNLIVVSACGQFRCHLNGVVNFAVVAISETSPTSSTQSCGGREVCTEEQVMSAADARLVTCSSKPRTLLLDRCRAKREQLEIFPAENTAISDMSSSSSTRTWGQREGFTRGVNPTNEYLLVSGRTRQLLLLVCPNCVATFVARN